MSFLKTLGITVDSDPRVTVTSATVTISEEERAANELLIDKLCALRPERVATGSEQMQRVYAYTVKNKEQLKASLRAITREPIQSAELSKTKQTSQQILGSHESDLVVLSRPTAPPISLLQGQLLESAKKPERLYPDLSDLPKIPSWLPTRLMVREPIVIDIKKTPSPWLIKAFGSMWRSPAYAIPLKSFLASMSKAPKDDFQFKNSHARIFMENVRALCPPELPMNEKIAFYEAAIQAVLRSYSSKALLPQKADMEELLRFNFYVGVIEEFIPKVNAEFTQDGEPDEAMIPFTAIRNEIIKLRLGEKQGTFSPEQDLLIQSLCKGDQGLHWYSLLYPVRELHDAYHRLKGRIEREEALESERPYLPLYHRRWQQWAWALHNVARIELPADFSTGDPITLEQARAKLPPMPSIEELQALIKQQEKKQKARAKKLESEFVIVGDDKTTPSGSVSKHALKRHAQETGKKSVKAESTKVNPHGKVVGHQLVSSDPSAKLKLLIERIEALKVNTPSPKRNQQLHDLFDELRIDKVKVKYAIYDEIGKKAGKIDSLQREYGRIHFADSLSALQSILRHFLSEATNSGTHVARSRLDERAVIAHPSTRKYKGYVDVVMRGKEPFYTKDDNWYIKQPVGVRYRLYHKLSMEERGKWVQELERFHRKYHAEFFPQWSTLSPSGMTDIYRVNYVEPMIKAYPDKRVMQSVRDMVSALEVGENEEAITEYINRIPKRFFDDATFLTFVREQAVAEGVKIEAWKKEWAKHHYKDDMSSLAQVIMRWFDHRISRYYEKTYGL